MTQTENEIEGIRQEYQRRSSDLRVNARQSPFNLGAVFLAQSLEREIFCAFKNSGITNLAGKKILDLGCGEGAFLNRFLGYGAEYNNLYGLDLMEERISRAQAMNPLIHFEQGNAEKLPYSNDTFDLILTCTVFSSILDETMRLKVGSEMIRVLSNQGIIIFVDFFYNPGNPNTIGITKKEISRLFPKCRMSIKKVLLAPPLARFIAPISPSIAHILEAFSLLRFHYLAVIKKDL